MSTQTLTAARQARVIDKARRQTAVSTLMANRVTAHQDILAKLAEVYAIRVSLATVKRDVIEVRTAWREERDELALQAFDQDLHAIDRLAQPLLAVAQGIALKGQPPPTYQDQARATRELVRLLQRRAAMIGYDKQPIREIEAAAAAMAENPQRVVIEAGPHPDDFANLDQDDLATYVRVSTQLGHTYPALGANN